MTENIINVLSASSRSGKAFGVVFDRSAAQADGFGAFRTRRSAGVRVLENSTVSTWLIQCRDEGRGVPAGKVNEPSDLTLQLIGDRPMPIDLHSEVVPIEVEEGTFTEPGHSFGSRVVIPWGAGRLTVYASTQLELNPV